MCGVACSTGMALFTALSFAHNQQHLWQSFVSPARRPIPWSQLMVLEFKGPDTVLTPCDFAAQLLQLAAGHVQRPAAVRGAVRDAGRLRRRHQEHHHQTGLHEDHSTLLQQLSHAHQSLVTAQRVPELQCRRLSNDYCLLMHSSKRLTRPDESRAHGLASAGADGRLPVHRSTESCPMRQLWRRTTCGRSSIRSGLYALEHLRGSLSGNFEHYASCYGEPSCLSDRSISQMRLAG